MGAGASPQESGLAQSSGLMAMGANSTFGHFASPALPPVDDPRVGNGNNAGAGAGDGSICSDSVAGSIDGTPMPPGTSPVGSLTSGWPVSGPAYAHGPAAFISSALGAAAGTPGIAAGAAAAGNASAAAAPPAAALHRGGPSSNYLSLQGTVSQASHRPLQSAQLQPQAVQRSQSLRQSPSSQQLFVAPESSGLVGSSAGSLMPQMQATRVGSHGDLQNVAPNAGATEAHQRLGLGPVNDRGSGPLHDALAAAGSDMWDLAEEPTRGPSRQLWLGNVQAWLPPGHLQVGFLWASFYVRILDRRCTKVNYGCDNLNPDWL